MVLSHAGQGGIYICYRRQETAPYARLLREELSRRLGADHVFMDVDSIEVGLDFTEAIQRAVDACQILLALVGPLWLTVTDAEGRRRLDDPDDIVRLEIEAALARDVRVIPVLVDNTPMPRRQELPESLAPLARRNALELSYNRYAYDVGRLIEVVERTLEGTARTVPSEARNQTTDVTDSSATIQPSSETLAPSKETKAWARRPVDRWLAERLHSDPQLPQTLKVFLCHSSSDKAIVRSLYSRLRADAIKPWMDENDILPGQDWDLEIRKAIRERHMVLVCLSADAITKVGYLQKEIRQVLDAADEQPEGTIFLIPVRLEPCNVPDRLRRWQWVDLFEDTGYDRLMLALGKSGKTAKVIVAIMFESHTRQLRKGADGR